MHKSLIGFTLAAVLSAPVFGGSEMHSYVIERDLPGAGQLSPQQLKEISAKSRDVLESLGEDIKWQQSYVTGDKLYCIYTAPNEEIIREHARIGGFPVTQISEVSGIISPATADQ